MIAEFEVLGEFRNSKLKAGESKNYSQTIAYSPRYKIEVDHEGRVTEARENNNIVRGTMDYVDLSITDIIKEPSQNGSILRVGVLNFNAKIKNNGNASANNVKVRAMDQNGIGGEKVSRMLIPAGEERTIVINLSPDQSWLNQNPHIFTITVDPDNAIRETNETNNGKVMQPIEVGSYKNAIIQFKMSDADEGTNRTIALMNEPTGVTTITGYLGTNTVSHDFHSLYSFDSWWRNQRMLVTGIDRNVFKSQIFGPFSLNVLPPDRSRGQDCQQTFEPFFKAKALAAGVNPDDFDTIIYVFLDKYREPGDPLIGNSGYQGTISSCAEQTKQAFIGIWNTTRDSDAMQIVLHEAGHVLGAADSYRPDPIYCMDPEGLPEPNKVPKFPQNKACLMCEKVVLDPTAPVHLDPFRNINDIDEDVMCREVVAWP